MSLIKCKECGKEISNKAKKCIHCGCPIINEGENIKNKSNLDNASINNNDNSSSSIGTNKEKHNSINVILVLILLLGFALLGYVFNWFSFMGINTAGIDGCYYKEDGKDALCFDNKNAYFTSDKEKKYYVKYYFGELDLKDEYGKNYTTCRKVEDSKNIICGNMVLYKK